MIQVIVCNLNKDGYAVSRYREFTCERRYQAIGIADQYDSVIHPITGKREYGTCIITDARAGGG